MTPKKNRADRKAIEKLFDLSREQKNNLPKSIFLSSNNLTFKFMFLDFGIPGPRISFIVSKKIAKKAVERNRLRRRGYDALGKYIDEFPSNLLGAFIFKNSQDSVPEIEKDIKFFLDKINVRNR